VLSSVESADDGRTAIAGRRHAELVGEAVADGRAYAGNACSGGSAHERSSDIECLKWLRIQSNVLFLYTYINLLQY
jgi:hypothetical protein